MSSLWAQQRTPSVHKSSEASYGPSEMARNTIHNLPGRHVDYGAVKGRTHQPGQRSSTSLRAPEVCNQPREVGTHPEPLDTVSGVHSGFYLNGDLSPSREGGWHRQGLPGSTAARGSLCSGPVQADRSDVGHNAGSAASTIMLLEPSEDKEPLLQPLTIIRDNCGFRPKCKGGAVVVDSSTHNMEWQSNPTSTPRPHSRDRCVPSRLGCGFRRSSHRGPVVRRGTCATHQPLGVIGGCTGCENICKAQEGHSCAIANGQQVDNLLHQPHGGNTISESGTPSMSAMAVVPPAGNNSLSRVSTRSGQWVSHHAILSRVDAQHSSVQLHIAGDGSMSDRPLCYTPQPPVESLRELPWQWMDSSFLGTISRVLLIPTICLGREVPPEDSSRGKHSDPSCPSVVDTTMVPLTCNF